jgi:hypothetical protein
MKNNQNGVYMYSYSLLSTGHCYRRLEVQIGTACLKLLILWQWLSLEHTKSNSSSTFKMVSFNRAFLAINT